MKRTQVLASGITIRQDFTKAVRLVLFETGFDGWEYGTHGGTAFVINYEGKVYAVTCQHIRKDFQWRQLVVANTKYGEQIAGIHAVYHASKPRESAAGNCRAAR